MPTPRAGVASERMAVKAVPLLAVRPMTAEGLANRAAGGVKIVGVKVPPTYRSPVVVALPPTNKLPVVVVLPWKKVSPCTASLKSGLEVPMPTLPSVLILNCSLPAVDKIIAPVEVAIREAAD